MLKKIQILLRAIGTFIGRINTFILMALSFYLILLPMAMIRRMFVSGERRPHWHRRAQLNRNHFEKQY